MYVTPLEGRNIMNLARRIAAEKVIAIRRGWELMANGKGEPDVVETGRLLLSSYRALMIHITSYDWLDTDASSLKTDDTLRSLTGRDFIRQVTRYLLLELTEEQLHLLIEHAAKSIFYWSLNTERKQFVLNKDKSDFLLAADVEEATQEDVINLLIDQMHLNLDYITVILLSDLHHLTFVVSADQCSEILS